MAARFALLVENLERTISSEVDELLRAFEAALPELTTPDATALPTVLPALRRLAELTGTLGDPSIAKRAASLMLGLRSRCADDGQGPAAEWAMAHPPPLLKPAAPPAEGARTVFAATSSGDFSGLPQPLLLEALALLSHTTRLGDDLVREVKRREMERRLMLDLGVGACRAADPSTVLDAFDPRIAEVRPDGLRHDFFVLVPFWAQAGHPQAPTDVQGFATALAGLTDNLVEEVVGPHLAAGRVVVSGSSVLFCLLPWDSDDDAISPCHDVDLFLIGHGPYDELLADIETRFAAAAARRSKTATISRSRNALSLSCGAGLALQVVLKAFPTVEHLLLATDLDCCSVAYDGTRVLCLPRFVLALATKTNFLDATQRPLQIRRVVKYRERGYCAAVPVEFPENVDPLPYCAAVAGALYHARASKRGYVPLASSPWDGQELGAGLCDASSRSGYDAQQSPGVAQGRPELCGALHNSALAELRPATPAGACGCARCRPLALRPAPHGAVVELSAALPRRKEAGLYESARFSLGAATFTLTAICGDHRRMCFALTLCDGGPCAVAVKGGHVHALCAATPALPLRRRAERSSKQGTEHLQLQLVPAPVERELGPAEGRALRGKWCAPWAPAVHQAFPDAIRRQVRALFLLVARGWLCEDLIAGIVAFQLPTWIPSFDSIYGQSETCPAEDEILAYVEHDSGLHETLGKEFPDSLEEFALGVVAVAW